MLIELSLHVPTASRLGQVEHDSDNVQVVVDAGAITSIMPSYYGHIIYIGIK